MEYLTVILILIIFGLGMWVWKLRNDKFEQEGEALMEQKEKDEYIEMGRGLAEYNKMVQEKREKAKAKILEMLALRQAQGNQGGIGCGEAAKELHISNASARRYFDDLEAENKVKQVGKTGKNVFYSKI
mgnify:CR=1 FL=1